MPPLSGFGKLQLAAHSSVVSGQNRFLEVLLIVLVIVTIAWSVVAYISQSKSRVVDTVAETSEKPIVPKRILKRQDSGVCQNHWECDHNNYLNSLKHEILQQAEKPVHPWISPPQALPGPYDPMYYPLPAPTFRSKISTSLPTNVEGRRSTSYTRLVPRPDTPLAETVLYGTMTTSTNGWRRSHWNVTGG